QKLNADHIVGACRAGQAIATSATGSTDSATAATATTAHAPSAAGSRQDKGNGQNRLAAGRATSTAAAAATTTTAAAAGGDVAEGKANDAVKALYERVGIDFYQPRVKRGRLIASE